MDFHAWSQQTLDAFPVDELQPEILKILDADDRIPFVVRRGEYLYNFWRDKNYPQGVWRRTKNYPHDWELLLDISTLGPGWVYKGAVVRAPEYDRALIMLSQGGSDAVEIREFDIEEKQFVDGGFFLPEAKTSVTWVDRDTLLVGTDTGPGSLTTSGYPRQLRWLRRTEPLGEVVAETDTDDVLITAANDPLTVTRALDFYSSRTSVLIDDHFTELPLPTDCNATVNRDRLIINPRTDTFNVPAGGLGYIDLETFLNGSREFTLAFTPGEKTSLQGVNITQNFLVLTILDSVSTTLKVVGKHSFTLDVPPQSSASVVASNYHDGDEIWVAISSFTTPTTLYRVDVSTSRELEEVITAPARFDAQGHETRQHWVTSKDGTEIPYFISGKFEGEKPTLVGGYGGFEVSLTPGYSPVQGAMWDGYRVTPNLRGGGEFGPTWHSQVTGKNRIKVWEDHEAVLRDLVRRGYARPEHIAIRGGSNGGLLTAGALNMYPDAFGAAVIQVPLTDMLNYHRLSAGASWMAEYGNPDNPDEREAIERWSPLHNVAGSVDKQYPPALITTSAKDDRVHPDHARHFAQALKNAGHEVDYYENEVGGHAGASDNTQAATVEALIYTWLKAKINQS